MSDTSADDRDSVGAVGEDEIRQHADEPAEGADPAEDAPEIPREHAEDPAEG